MLRPYPLWKYLLLLVLVIVGILYAIPNLFVDEPAVQISANRPSARVDGNLEQRVTERLKQEGLPYKSLQRTENQLTLRFYDINEQLKARDVLQATLLPATTHDVDAQDEYTVALNLVSSTPPWLKAIGARPMKLGLDLRGGVHFLLEVDTASLVDRNLQNFSKVIAKQLREQNLRYQFVIFNQKNKLITAQFTAREDGDVAYALILKDFPDLKVEREFEGEKSLLRISFSPQALQKLQQEVVEQTMTTLRNRVNELGVAEAVVQQQGINRIAVDLPGIQDAAHAKQILGGTATLEFYLVDLDHDANQVAASGVVPLGSKLYRYEEQPILLKNNLVLSGDAIVSARTGFDESGMPAVHVSIGGGSANFFSRVTQQNVGKPLAIVYIETKMDSRTIGGEEVKTRRKIERVVSAPRIQTALGSNFQITGLNAMEAKNLALLLRAGSLPTAIDIVEERTIGPSLGAENIKRGMDSLLIGMLLVIVFMAVYYRLFGLIADLALVFNLVLLVAILSIAGATLTLPGIAGIVLTVGMAVDSNVLIFERIREELRAGMTAHGSIAVGYEKAFATIIDSNVTTLIVAVVLFSIGSGAVRGFAITLTIGLLTSLLTAITFTLAVVHGIYARPGVKKLSIGI